MDHARAAAGQPANVAALQAAYGAPSQAAFGSAVFTAPAAPGVSLEQAALATYRHFVGELWMRYGEDAWMSPWQLVYTRPPHALPNIVTELAALPDHAARLAASLLLENLPDPSAAHAALAAAFDDPAVTALALYRIGDGAAMSGILLVGLRPTDHIFTLLILLMD